MRRSILGVSGGLLLLGAAYFLCFPPDPSSGILIALHNACFRLGPILFLIFISFPDVERIPRSVWLLMLSMMLVLAWRPRVLLILVPVIIMYLALRPRKKKTSRAR